MCTPRNLDRGKTCELSSCGASAGIGMLELEKAGFSVDSSGTLGPEIPMGVGLKSFATLLLISAICTRLTDFRAYSLDGWGTIRDPARLEQ